MMSSRWQMFVMAMMVSALALGSVGCKKKPKPGAGMGGTDVASIDGGETVEGSDIAGGTIGREGDGVRGQFSAVYFDYDSAIMRGGEESKLQAVAEHLRSNQGATLLVEGHCDERGSNEYNLSLGDRRAMAVRAYLVGLGIDGSRVNTKSLGEEQPAAPMGPEEEKEALGLMEKAVDEICACKEAPCVEAVIKKYEAKFAKFSGKDPVSAEGKARADQLEQKLDDCMAAIIPRD